MARHWTAGVCNLGCMSQLSAEEEQVLCMLQTSGWAGAGVRDSLKFDEEPSGALSREGLMASPRCVPRARAIVRARRPVHSSVFVRLGARTTRRNI